MNPELHKRGVVIRSTGSYYMVMTDDGERIESRLRGKFRISGIKSTNPIAVGDRVKVDLSGESPLIAEIEPRKNFLLRKSVNLSKRVHILCANIDQALILFTVASPVTTLGYLDRLLVTCEAYDIPPVIIFNKIDLAIEAGEGDKLHQFTELYTSLGYPCVQVNSTDPVFRDAVLNLLKDKTNFVVGRSGTGKSTFINLVEPELDLKTGHISDISERGKHTTTYAEMFPLTFGGFIIDSPGFKEMETYAFEPNELTHFYPEMSDRIYDCRFNDCLHVNEPGCAIREAVDTGEIAESRYHTYLSILQEIQAQQESRF